MVTGKEGESVEAQETAGERVSNQSKYHRERFGKEHQRERDIVSARPPTRRRSC